MNILIMHFSFLHGQIGHNSNFKIDQRTCPFPAASTSLNQTPCPTQHLTGFTWLDLHGPCDFINRIAARTNSHQTNSLYKQLLLLLLLLKLWVSISKDLHAYKLYLLFEVLYAKCDCYLRVQILTLRRVKKNKHKSVSSWKKFKWSLESSRKGNQMTLVSQNQTSRKRHQV